MSRQFSPRENRGKGEEGGGRVLIYRSLRIVNLERALLAGSYTVVSTGNMVEDMVMSLRSHGLSLQQRHGCYEITKKMKLLQWA